MTTSYSAADNRAYNRHMLRSAFQSLFWHVLKTRKRETGFTLKALADKLGIHKSYVSRSFSEPPNWQIDKISDMAEALGIDIIVAAKDRITGKIYLPSGDLSMSVAASVMSTEVEAKLGSPAQSEQSEKFGLVAA